MATTYERLKREIVKLEAEAQRAKQKEVKAVVARIREAIDQYGLTAQDLGLVGTRNSSKQTLVKAQRKSKAKLSTTPKFQDEQGNTWVGRGPRPHWLRGALSNGKSLEDFAVK